ncbi:MAG: pseudouridine synthase [Gemella sp.]|nr:pseudouridine synthase [Gemella sp.]
MRLDKFISNNTQYSRSEVKRIIKKGILVNGEVIKDSKFDINPDTDLVTLNGEELKNIEFVYIMMNKPQGCLSATHDSKDKTVLDLINAEDKIKDIFPVGRLDKDTEGLMFLTNDGELAHKLTSPKKDIFKKYYVEVDGMLTDEHVEMFKNGIVIDKDYRCKSSILEIEKASSEISSALVQISEGKFHQIKKMMRAIGVNVTYLKRISIGKLILDEKLSLGQYRYLTEEELDNIK